MQDSQAGNIPWRRKWLSITVSTTYWHLPRALPATKQQGHLPFASVETEVSLIAQLVKLSACNAGDPSLVPGSGRSPGEGLALPAPVFLGFLVAQLVKNPPAMRETWIRSLGWEDPQKGKANTPVFWPGEFHGLYSLWGCKESDMTEQLSLHLTSKIK